jgi:hypothetical protein
MVAFQFSAHDQQPVHSLGVLNLTETPMLVSGAQDGIKVYLSAISFF